MILFLIVHFKNLTVAAISRYLCVVAVAFRRTMTHLFRSEESTDSQK